MALEEDSSIWMFHWIKWVWLAHSVHSTSVHDSPEYVPLQTILGILLVPKIRGPPLKSGVYTLVLGVLFFEKC